MNRQIRPIADLYRFNSEAVRAVLHDLSDERAGQRWRDGAGSSITFLLGHLLSSRTELLKRFGAAEENPYAELFGRRADARDADAYPPIADLAEQWDSVADRLDAALTGLSDADLESPADGFPVDDRTVRGAAMFMAWHESYHVGQIGLMRTEMGLPSLQASLYAARTAA